MFQGLKKRARLNIDAQPLLESDMPAATMDEFSSKKSRNTSPTRSSLTEVEDEERDALLENVPLGEKKRGGENGRRKVHRTRYFYAIGFLLLSNLAFIVVFFILFAQKRTIEPDQLPSWAPPELYESRVFKYVDTFGGEPGPKSEAAWTNLIPSTSDRFIVLVEIRLCSLSICLCRGERLGQSKK